MMLANLFYNPLVLRSDSLLWLLIPLCASVAIVYKTIRTNYLGHLFREIVILMGYMLFGLVALGGALWLILAYWR